MRVRLESVFVSDQDHALRFYTEKLGFVKKRDIPMGHGARFLTVVSPEDPDGTELTAFEVDDCRAEHRRLSELGVEFKGEPTDAGTAIMAILDDTCGNLIMIYEDTSGS